MLTKTVEVDGVKFTVHTETGRHVFLMRMVLRKLARDYNDMLEFEVSHEFAQALVQSTDVTVPFAWPEVSADKETLNAALENWLELPGSVLRLWLEALTEVDTPPADPNLTPGADSKNA